MRTPSCARSKMSRTHWSRCATNATAPRPCRAPPTPRTRRSRHAQSLYDRGQIDLLPLLDAQRTRLTARTGANDSSTQLLLSTVQLFKALGGGWEAFEPEATQGRTVLKDLLAATAVAISTVSLLAACGSRAPEAEALRTVRTVEIRYDTARDANRYFGSVQARHEVDQAFRVGGKVMERRVDVGDTVREGDVLAVLDDVDLQAD